MDIFNIQDVDEVKTLILESVNVWKNYKKRVPSRDSQGSRVPRIAQTTRNVYSQLSGLEDVTFNDFIKDYFIPEGDGQVASGSVSLPDPVPLETEEQRLESEQNERDVLDLLLEKQQSVADQLASKYKSETYCWTKKLNWEDFG